MKKSVFLVLFVLGFLLLGGIGTVWADDCPTDMEVSKAAGGTCVPIYCDESSDCQVSACDMSVNRCKLSDILANIQKVNSNKKLGDNCNINAQPPCSPGLVCSPDGKCVQDEVSDSTASKGGSTSQGSGSIQSSASAEGGAYTAQTGQDQRCMTKDECLNLIKVSKDLTDEEAIKNFYSAKEHTDAEIACKGTSDDKGNEVGFCAPVGRAETRISFGGKTSFVNLGEFIQYMYRYIIGIAGILAVFMLVIAGVQWITSFGSTEKTTSAKKKISGAMVGLLIALASYQILNLINPYLVNLRLPQVWILKAQNIVPRYCSLTSTSTFAFAYNEADKAGMSSAVLAKKLSNATFNLLAKDVKCGSYFFQKGGGDKPCAGSKCNTGEACVYGLNNKMEYQCIKAMLAGTINAQDTLFCGDLGATIIDNNLMLLADCPDGKIEMIHSLDIEDGARDYAFPDTLKGAVKSACNGKAVGFYLGAEVNDERGGFFGRTCSNSLSSGSDDWHAIGLLSPADINGECKFNLGKFASEKIFARKTNDCKGGEGVKTCSCRAISSSFDVQRLVQNEEFVKHLIKKESLLAGYQCNISIDRAEFPAVDNGGFSGFWDDPTSCKDQQ